MLISAIRDVWQIFVAYTREAMSFAMIFAIVGVMILVAGCAVRIIKHKKMHSMGYVLLKTCLFALFGFYMSYILAITLSGRESMEGPVVKNLDPFSTLIRNGSLNIEIFENFLMFVPLGIILPCVWKYMRGFVRTTLVGLCMSIIIEVTQIILQKGFFDVDDIIFNTLGAAVGYVIFSGFYDGLLGIKRRVITDVSKKLKCKPPLGKLYDRFALRHTLVLFLVQSLPAVIWFNIVMGFSSDDGDKSSTLSRGLLKIFFPGGNEVPGDVLFESETFMFYEKILRKFAHMFEYAVLAFLIWAAFYSIKRLHKIMVYGLTLLGTFVVAMIDETNQMSVIGRTGTYRDVIVDMTGSIGALLITLVIIAWGSTYYKNKYS